MMKALYKEWRKLQRNKGKLHNVPKEEEFPSELKNLFDISSETILENIDVKQKEFLVNQNNLVALVILQTLNPFLTFRRQHKQRKKKF